MANALIVDDSKFMRRIIREVLEEGGHTVVGEADNGYDGIESYKTFKPDIVTMDITMGGQDGIKAAKEIIKFDKSAKIVVISALSENTIKLNDKDINPSAFLTKPFEKDNLLNMINKIL